MFNVASDLGEPIERDSQVPFSLQGMSVAFNTLEAVKTVFVEWFCTSKSSLENPSQRVNGHGGSTNRTFIVEDYAEDEFGQWAMDEVTGKQGYIDDESCVFGHGTTTRIPGSPHRLKVAK